MIPLTLRSVTQTRGKGHRAVQVLRGVDLVVASGERVLLEGPSGSGKTTLLATAAGLLTPDSGAVVVADRPISILSQAERAKLRATSVGFVFQRANLLASLTVLENVVLAGRLAGIPDPETRQRSQLILEQLDLGSLMGRYPRELSGGEEQRVAVARALVHRPAIVLADEPTGNLDRAAGRTVADSIAEVAMTCGSAVLIATHDERMARIATRSVRLADGHLIDGS